MDPARPIRSTSNPATIPFTIGSGTLADRISERKRSSWPLFVPALPLALIAMKIKKTYSPDGEDDNHFNLT